MNKKTLTLLAVVLALAWAAPAFAQADDITRMETQLARTSSQQSDLDKFLGKCIMRLVGRAPNVSQKQAQPQKKTQPKKQAPAKKEDSAKKQTQSKKQAPAKKQTKKQVQPDISPSVTQGGWHSII